MQVNRSNSNYSGAASSLIGKAIKPKSGNLVFYLLATLIVMLLFAGSRSYAIIAQDNATPETDSTVVSNNTLLTVQLFLSASPDSLTLVIPDNVEATSLTNLEFKFATRDTTYNTLSLKHDFPNVTEVVSGPACFIYRATDSKTPLDDRCPSSDSGFHIYNISPAQLYWYSTVTLRGSDILLFNNNLQETQEACSYIVANNAGGCPFNWSYQPPPPVMPGWIDGRSYQVQAAPVMKADFRGFVSQGGWNPDKNWWSGDAKDWLQRFKEQVPVEASRIEFSTSEPMLGMSWYAANAYCRSQSPSWYLPGQEALIMALSGDGASAASKEWTSDTDGHGKYVVIDANSRQPSEPLAPESQDEQIGFRCAAPR